MNEVIEIFNFGRKNVTKNTNGINANSSRCHSVFQIKIIIKEFKFLGEGKFIWIDCPCKKASIFLPNSTPAKSANVKLKHYNILIQIYAVADFRHILSPNSSFNENAK